MTRSGTAFALSALLAAMLLAGCTSYPGSIDGPPDLTTASGHAAGSASAPVDAVQVGTCTREEGGDSGGPMIFTVATDTDNYPIQLSYPAFNSDGSVDIVTETVTGPLIVRTSYPCSATALSSLWVTTATSETPEHLSCTLSIGGSLIATQQRWHQMLDTLDVLCQGHAVQIVGS